jgi:hypothetical protein
MPLRVAGAYTGDPSDKGDQTMFITFTATNHQGSRLPWYFDNDTDQANLAYGFAVAHGFAHPTHRELVSRVPADDIVTDAGEFARWLTGDMADDALAMGESRMLA